MPIGGYEYSKQLSGAPASCQRPLYLPAPELRAKVLELITHAHDAPASSQATPSTIRPSLEQSNRDTADEIW